MGAIYKASKYPTGAPSRPYKIYMYIIKYMKKSVNNLKKYGLNTVDLTKKRRLFCLVAAFFLYKLYKW